MYKKTLVGALALALTLGWTLIATPPAAQAAEVKIGVIDIQKVINDSKKGKEAKGMLIKKFEAVQKDLDLRRAEIEKLKLELERQGSVLDPEVRFEKERSLQKKMRDFDDRYRDATEEMRREEQRNTRPLFVGISQVVAKIGKDRGYTVILEKTRSMVVYSPDAIDLTPEVTRIFDATP
jgi:outer membrane protein